MWCAFVCTSCVLWEETASHLHFEYSGALSRLGFVFPGQARITVTMVTILCGCLGTGSEARWRHAR